MPWAGSGSSQGPRGSTWNYPPAQSPPRARASRTPLEGRWLSPDGHTLEIAANRFQLSAANQPVSEGTLMVNGNRLVLYHRAQDATQLLQMELRQDFLMLANDQGQVMQFQRDHRSPRSWSQY